MVNIIFFHDEATFHYEYISFRASCKHPFSKKDFQDHGMGSIQDGIISIETKKIRHTQDNRNMKRTTTDNINLPNFYILSLSYSFWLLLEICALEISNSYR